MGERFLKLKLSSAGHIPGAAMLNVETDTHKLLFTGDFDTRFTACIRCKTRKCDVLFVEGTYGSRNHPSKEETTQAFIDRITNY